MPKKITAINYWLVILFHLPATAARQLFLPWTPAETQKSHLRLQ